MSNRMIDVATSLMLSQIMVDNNDYRGTVFLAGTGRSGTTWIANIINYDNSYRLMFEPFHSQKVDIVRHFQYRQYLRPENHDQKFLEPAKAILSGNVKNMWIDVLNRRIVVKKRLIKDIRANHLLKWIKTNFPEIPMILLLRHPCAVAHSKLKKGWDTHLEGFLAQNELMEDFLSPFRSEIEGAESTFEKHIFMWCIENYVPLKQFNNEEIHLAFYENFCVDPEQEIDRLFSFLHQSYRSEVFNTVNTPSMLARKESAINSGENLTESWKKHLSEKQIRRAIEILSLFGLERIYSEDPMPLICPEQNIQAF